MRRLCAVSVDLDEVGEYRALHGLPPRAGAHAVYDVALPRALELAGRRVPLTLFAIGKDLDRAQNAGQLRAAVRVGAIVESHSHGHRYDLARLTPAPIREDLLAASAAIEAATGRRPRGFRAPGYGTSPALHAALADLGFRFDASALPSPPYYLAKLAAMARVRARGRQTAAIVHPLSAAWGSRQPHALGPLVEIPMTVTPVLRLPVIGTSLALAGSWLARRMVRSCFGDAVLSLELHGLDFLDATDGLDDLALHQPDVRIPLAAKLAIFDAVFTDIERAGYHFVPLESIPLDPSSY